MQLNKISPYCYEIPRSGSMNVPGRIFMSGSMANGLSEEEALKQVANVATLPGILKSGHGHARHALGLRFSHRRGGRLRLGHRNHFSGRRGLRHQLRGASGRGTGLEEKERFGQVVDRLVEALFRNIPSGGGLDRVGKTVSQRGDEGACVKAAAGPYARAWAKGWTWSALRTGGCMVEASIRP